MKNTFKDINFANLCGWFGLSRQAYYQHIKQTKKKFSHEEIILFKIHEIREKHPRLGTRKLYGKIQPLKAEHNIKIGRDALFNLLNENKLLIRKRKRRVHTTQSSHWLRKYPNLIKDIELKEKNQLWVSDITYWRIKDNFVYLSLITDAFSHKIVGWNVAETLEGLETVQALKMALSGFLREPESHFKLIHHSDRGVQYCQYQYVKLLQEHNIQISMTQTGDPRDNAVAERINGILKDEYLLDSTIETISEAKNKLTEVIDLYNNDRPHMSIGNYCPEEIHQNNQKKDKLWKTYYKKNPIFVNQN